MFCLILNEESILCEDNQRKPKNQGHSLIRTDRLSLEGCWGLRLVTNWSACEASRAEATVNSMRCFIRQNIAKWREKALRLPENHPKRKVFEGVCRSILKRRLARFETENLYKELSEHHRAPFKIFYIKPWIKGLEKVTVFGKGRQCGHNKNSRRETDH